MSAEGLTIKAPEAVDAPLTVWDIAFASGQSSEQAVPGFVNEVSATFAAPRSGGVVLALDGPGIFSPLSATRFDNVRSGGSVTSR